MFNRQQTTSLSSVLSEVTDPDFLRKVFSTRTRYMEALQKRKHPKLHLLEVIPFYIFRFIRNIKSIFWKSYGFPIISFIYDGLIKNYIHFWTNYTLTDCEPAGPLLKTTCNLHTQVMQLIDISVNRYISKFQFER